MFGWWQHLVASTCSAIISRLVTYPLDTLRVKIQSSRVKQDEDYKPESGWLQLRHSLKGVSVSSLYNGLAVALVFSAPALTLYQGTYDGVKWLLVDTLRLLTHDAFLCHILGACAAEVVSNLMWTPMELIKSQMQAGKRKTGEVFYDNDDSIPFTLLTTDAARTSEHQHHHHEEGEIDQTSGIAIGRSLTWRDACRLAYGIWRNDGLLGFLRGYWLGVFIYAPYSIFSLTSAASATIIDDNTHYPMWIYLFGSAIACMIGAILTNPLDVVRTRWQVSHGDDRAVARANNWLSVAAHLWQYEGRWRAFMRGVWARVLSMVPGAVLSWTIFEMFHVYYTTPTAAIATSSTSLI
ncbi:mitochondrial carrier domain-containing protein [Syncephalis plumigaleata]|nr:mitochondrial carrier domain-containing protein [Syncephalis plumigaleata]